MIRPNPMQLFHVNQPSLSLNFNYEVSHTRGLFRKLCAQVNILVIFHKLSSSELRKEFSVHQWCRSWPHWVNNRCQFL